MDVITDDDIVDLFENPLPPQPQVKHLWKNQHRYPAFQPKYIELDNMQFDFFGLPAILFERYCQFKRLQAETQVSLYDIITSTMDDDYGDY
jgi:hypothetical protein